ncbi:uncharacterized protein MONBRDRAFT_27706 [Monosiga brevicollis MX1]|uniref:Uncharacterized protein n=1 Tax=Monosiga brevicollis TaxID=81824 RepID=A9V626_MONBE|nr:uncharacterized protein MONBRDRAFT_27706 [Monosiga brevicollis MX1]EDQ86999.1 predicted protein [Monosiga brevicollis MX1]|eukprot:XP_001748238.1 hypothetical protein [Monosiga brevicollis MX1]
MARHNQVGFVECDGVSPERLELYERFLKYRSEMFSRSSSKPTLVCIVRDEALDQHRENQRIYVYVPPNADPLGFLIKANLPLASGDDVYCPNDGYHCLQEFIYFSPECKKYLLGNAVRKLYKYNSLSCSPRDFEDHVLTGNPPDLMVY